MPDPNFQLLPDPLSGHFAALLEELEAKNSLELQRLSIMLARLKSDGSTESHAAERHHEPHHADFTMRRRSAA